MAVAERIGYPVLVRPSLRARRAGHGDRLRRRPRSRATCARPSKASPEHPILIDQFLEDAFEVDVDAVGDGERVVIGGILQHIEEAGIHSGDSAHGAAALQDPPQHLATHPQDYTRAARPRARASGA